MTLLTHPRADDLARALREQATPRDIAILVRGTAPAHDPVPFKMLSGPIVAHPASDQRDAPVVIGTTSSTSKDLYDTRMTRTALSSMLRDALDNLTVFMDHNYTIPESIFGTCVGAQMVDRQAPSGTAFTDLDFAVRVVGADVNPRAVQCYNAIQGGTKLGFSIGAMMLDWEWQTPDGQRIDVADQERDWNGTPLPPAPDAQFSITDVLMVESSLVGVPANRRSWVHDARRSLEERGLMKGPTSFTFPVTERTINVAKTDKPALALSTDAPDTLRDYGTPPPADTTPGADAGRDPHSAEPTLDPDGLDALDALQDAAAPVGDDRSLEDLERGLNASYGIVAADDATVKTSTRTAVTRKAVKEAKPAKSKKPGKSGKAGTQPAKSPNTPSEGVPAKTKKKDKKNRPADVSLTPFPKGKKKKGKKNSKNGQQNQGDVNMPKSGEINPARPDKGAKARDQDRAVGPDTTRAPEITTIIPDVDALRAEVAHARTVRDELHLSVKTLLNQQKSLTKSVKKAAKVLRKADDTGLYRPTRGHALRDVTLTDADLIGLDDADLAKHLTSHVI